MVAVTTIDAVDVEALRTLPVNADEGFPQAFLLGMSDRTYRIELYVKVAESELPRRGLDPRTLVDVTGDGVANGPRGSLIGAVIRQDAGGDVVLLRRRLLPGLAYHAGDLTVAIVSAEIAVGNLNGVGSFGSSLIAKVEAR